MNWRRIDMPITSTTQYIRRPIVWKNIGVLCLCMIALGFSIYWVVHWSVNSPTDPRVRTHFVIRNHTCNRLWSPKVYESFTEDQINVVFLCKTGTRFVDAKLQFLSSGVHLNAKTNIVDEAVSVTHATSRVFNTAGDEFSLGQPELGEVIQQDKLNACSQLMYQNTHECRTCFGTLADEYCHIPSRPKSRIEGGAWGEHVPRLTPSISQQCQSTMWRRPNGSSVWAPVVDFHVINGIAPYHAGTGLSRGLRLKYGPHAGRMVIAVHYNCNVFGDGPQRQAAMYRAGLLYSDNGISWTAGEMLPTSWTECHITEMTNGSILMSSRRDWAPWFVDKYNPTRMLARSDDGGSTWSEIWDITTDDQRWLVYPRIAAGIATDHNTGDIYQIWQDQMWQGSAGIRVLKSKDGGKHWDPFAVLGYPTVVVGYADIIVHKNSIIAAFMESRDGAGPIPQKWAEPPGYNNNKRLSLSGGIVVSILDL